MSKRAEEETAMTAMTPHWPGAVTTRAAAAGGGEAGRGGDGHDGHGAALHGVGDDEVRRVWDAAGHVQGEDDDAFFPDLGHRFSHVSARQSTREHGRHGPREAGHGPRGSREVLLAD